jgi:aldehyde:ferredoxin oxidoreductase
MFGFYGRILTVKLTDESFEIETLSGEIYGQVLGGKGLATHLLLMKNPPGVDPLSAENPLISGTCRFWKSRLQRVPSWSPATRATIRNAHGSESLSSVPGSS